MAREGLNKEALYAENTDLAFIELMTINHPDLDAQIRVVNGNDEVVSNGNTYQPFPFQMQLPDDDGERLGTATLELRNVDLIFSRTVRQITSPPTMDFQLIMSNDLDDVQMEYVGLTTQSVDYNANTIRFYLSYEDILNLSYPYQTYNKVNFTNI